MTFTLQTIRNYISHLVEQVSKVIWQKAASPYYRPSRLRMHSYAACAGQTHSPASFTAKRNGSQFCFYDNNYNNSIISISIIISISSSNSKNKTTL